MKNNEQLRKASERLWYEIWMFDNLAHRLPLDVFKDDVVTHNALLESFAIHARALYHFFYDEEGKPDDITAQNFFIDSKCWTDLRPEITKVLLKAKKKTDKEIAHLSYIRLDINPEEKTWDIEQICNDLGSIIDIFKANVSKDLLGERWKTVDPRHIFFL